MNDYPSKVTCSLCGWTCENDPRIDFLSTKHMVEAHPDTIRSILAADDPDMPPAVRAALTAMLELL